MANMQANVDIEGMKRAQVTFQEAVDECTRSYASVEGQVDALSSSWRSKAADIYSDGIGEWLENFNTLTKSLQTMLQQLADTTHVQANAHEDTMHEANSVRQTVSGGALNGLPGFPS